eukprot:2763137-Prymnesium_polylepis.1
MRHPPDLVCFRRPRINLRQRPRTTGSAAHPRLHPLQRCRGVPRETRFGPLSSARVTAAD